MAPLCFTILASVGLIILLWKAEEKDVKNVLLNALFTFVSIVVALIMTAYFSNIGGKIDGVTIAINDSGKRINEKLSEVGERLAKIETRIDAIEKIDIAQMKRQSLLKDLIKKMYNNASPAERAILIKDTSLFMLNPEVFAEIHANDMPSLKQHAEDFKNLGVLMQTLDLIPPQ